MEGLAYVSGSNEGSVTIPSFPPLFFFLLGSTCATHTEALF